MSDVAAIDMGRRNNADLIHDVAQLGYLDGDVLDLTYGLGNFWTGFRPENLTTNDADITRDVGLNRDFRFTGLDDASFDAVVFDPPYRLNGRPDQSFDHAYGISVPTRWQERMEIILDGVAEACRLSRRTVLVKCQAQVVSGSVRWQDIEVVNRAELLGYQLVDRFDLVTAVRPQPPGRAQKHARRNHSTLLVLE